MGKITEYNDFQSWLNMSRTQRVRDGLPLTMVGFGKKAGVTLNTLYRWRDKIQKNGQLVSLADMPEVVEVTKMIMQEKADSFDSKLFLKSKQREVCEKLMGRILAEKANAKDFELYYKLADIIEVKEEKKEVKKDDFTININNLIAVARQQLKDSGEGDVREIEVSNVSTILSGKPLLNTGQGDGVNAPVQTMGLSEEPTQDDREE